MNYIFLEGTALYLFLILIILMFLISLGSLLYSVFAEKRIRFLYDLLSEEKNKTKYFLKENFKLKLKCGEFDDK